MKRYYNRKKPLEAEQWDGEPHPLVIDCTVITVTGRTPIRPGDYILQDTHLGVTYTAVGKRAVFESSYEEVTT